MTSKLAFSSQVKTKSLRFLSLIKYQLLAHLILCISCVTFFLCAVIVNTHLGRPTGFSAWAYLSPIITVILPITIGMVLIGIFAYLLFIKKPDSPLREMVTILSDIFLDPRRWAKVIPAIGIMMLGFAAFTELKPLIPVLNPFEWDERFASLDRFIHFGQDPWRLLMPIFGYAKPTFAINFIYNLWFFIMFGFWAASGFTKKDNGWERQFLVSFIWCWMFGGVLLATYFSSMGPAFYDLIDPVNNPFALQIEELKKLDSEGKVWALATHDMLRESYLKPDSGSISGISAMPSMHNATSMIFMLAAFRIHKIFGWIMAGFLSVIVIGSVHLAWHYAVDAYAGIIIALFIWWASGKTIKWQDKALSLPKAP